MVKMLKIASIVAGLSAVLLLASGANADDKKLASVRSTLTNADVIAARQSAFLMSAANFGSMKGAIDRGDEVKTLSFQAMTLARWARTLPLMFPVGTVAENSEALPVIWKDRTGFDAKAKDYADAATKLAGFARANDKAGFATQWAAVRQACSACHDVYKKPNTPPAPPAPVKP